jgi:phosphoribosylglycinamide formyltransferase 1
VKSRLAILDSGDGDKLQAILDACKAGTLQAMVTVVVSDARESRALDCAESAGIPALYHPFDWYCDTGRGPEDYDAALVELIAPYEPDWVVLVNRFWEPYQALLERYPSRIVDARNLEGRPLIDTLARTIHLHD